jgi:hypothetical protein
MSVETRGPAAGHIRGRQHPHDTWHGRRVFGLNLQDARAWMRGQHHRAVQHAGHAHVVHEWLFAERLRLAALARQRGADTLPPAVAVLGVAVQPEVFAEEVVPPRLLR